MVKCVTMRTFSAILVIATCMMASPGDGLAQSGSLKLDGSGFAFAPDDPDLTIGTSSLSVEAWIKHDGNSDEDAVILTKRDGARIDYKLTLVGEGEEVAARFYIFSGSYSATSSVGIPAGRWTHVAGTYDGTTIGIYIDGQLRGSRTTSGNTRDNTGDLVIGTNAAKNSQFFSGEIDEVRIWTTALSGGQLLDGMVTSLAGNEAGLTAYFPFSDDGADAVNDNDLSLMGDAEYTDGGILPVPPDLYGMAGNASASLTWHNRDADASASFKVYRSTASDFGDRQEISSEGSGTLAFDDSGISNGTTYYYQVTTVNQGGDESDFSFPVAVTPYATGGGGSLSLDGSGYARMADSPSLNLGNQSVTVEAWIKHDGQVEQDAVILSKRSGARVDYKLAFEGSGEEPAVRFYVYSTSYFAASSHGIPAGEWTHVLGMWDGTTISVYVNGMLSGTRTTSGDTRDNEGALIVGANSSANGQFFIGQIDEIRIWDRLFTPQELRARATARLTGSEEDLRAYYRFDDVGEQEAYRSTVPGSLQLVGSAEIVASGVFPLPPKIYGHMTKGTVALEWLERVEDYSDSFVLYRSTSAEGEGRTEVTTAGAESTSYVDSDVELQSSYFYEVTSIVEGQESDYSYFTAVTPSETEEGNALLLSGSGYVRADPRPSLDIGSQSLTVEAWINYDAASESDARVVDKTSGARVDYRLDLAGSGDERLPRFLIYSGSYSATASDPVPPGEWVHIAGVYDTGTISIYVNGELAGTRATSGNTRENDGPLMIGTNPSGNGNFYVGLIDEVRIWSTARTMFEIRDFKDRILMGNEEHMVGYFRFDETGGTITHASDGFPKTATLVGDATFSVSGAPVPFEDDAPNVPDRFVLEGNYPNPFNPTTTIRYGLPEASGVTITVYDALGREVGVLVEGNMQSAGWHEVSFDAAHLPSGLYLYRLEASEFSQTGRMMLIK